MSSQPSLFPAIATILAAVIAAAISFVNMTMSKEQKTSEFRQAWIDALRDDIAAFLSSARIFARAHEEHSNDSSLFSDEKIREVRHEASERLYKIRLRLNLNEKEHLQLMDLLQQAIDEQNKNIATSLRDSKNVFDVLELVANHSAALLKAEWKRVKRGELAFRVARTYIAPLIILSGIIAAGYLLLSTTRF